MQRPVWAIDRSLAEELAAALGWAPDDGVAVLARAIPEHVPCGSTAKLAAMAAGEVPPGADAETLARRILGHLRTGEPTPTWSCWVVATVMAALVETLGTGSPSGSSSGSTWAEVVAMRRIDDRSPVVDIHSAVLVPDGDGIWVCDPFFGSAVSVAGEFPSGASGTTWGPHRFGPTTAAVRLETDQRWTHDVHLAAWPQGLRYRSLAPALDRQDVHAFCAISVAHSGVPFRPYARINHCDGVTSMAEDAHGRIRLATGSPAIDAVDPSGWEETEAHFDSWEEAIVAFAERTNLRIT